MTGVRCGVKTLKTLMEPLFVCKMSNVVVALLLCGINGQQGIDCFMPAFGATAAVADQF